MGDEVMNMINNKIMNERGNNSNRALYMEDVAPFFLCVSQAGAALSPSPMH